MARGVQRTSSLGFSRTSSFASIHEDNNDDRPDQEDSFKKVSHMPSTSSHSSLQASSPIGSVRRTGSTKDVLFDGSAKDGLRPEQSRINHLCSLICKCVSPSAVKRVALTAGPEAICTLRFFRGATRITPLVWYHQWRCVINQAKILKSTICSDLI